MGVGLLRLCALPRVNHLFRALSPEATAAFAAGVDGATQDAFVKILTAKLTTLPQQTQTALPVRLGGCGLWRCRALRAAAWVGSWLGTLPEVRGLAGPEAATREVIEGGSAGWASSLRQAVTALAAGGVHLDQGGGVVRDEPVAAWAWEDGAPVLFQRQRLLSRLGAERDRERLLGSVGDKARARVRSCGGVGAGAWLLAAPTSRAASFTDLEFKVCVRLRLRIPLHIESLGARCRNRRTTEREPGDGSVGQECRESLDPESFHALVCSVGGRVVRRHNALRDVLAALLREAGYVVDTEVYEPAWTRARTTVDGRVEVEQAKLDVRLAGPPSDPLVYGGVVVTHPEGTAWRAAAARTDGAAANGAAAAKHRRYPAWCLPGGRLVPFAVDTFGRWGHEAETFLREAAFAACERSPQLSCLGAAGPAGLLGAWHCRLSAVLQKGNAACVLEAGRIRDGADLAGDCGWEEDLEDLLRQAAAFAAAGGLDG